MLGPDDMDGDVVEERRHSIARIASSALCCVWSQSEKRREKQRIKATTSNPGLGFVAIIQLGFQFLLDSSEDLLALRTSENLCREST